MAIKKNINSNKIYYLSKDRNENPKLGAKIFLDKKLNREKESLFLDYYLGYRQEIDSNGKIKTSIIKKRKTLHLYLWRNPTSVADRLHNKETLLTAEKIRQDEANRLFRDRTGYNLVNSRIIGKNTEFHGWVKENFAEHLGRTDTRMVKAAIKKFKTFLASSRKYRAYADWLNFDDIDRDMVLDFVDYLKRNSKGEGARSMFQRFKKVINYAIETEKIGKNPCKGITIKIDDNVLKKDILSQAEIIQLLRTDIKDEHQDMNPNIRRAFVFSLYTGIRFCDIKGLRYRNVDFSNKLLKFEQKKVAGYSSNSGVIIPLNEGLLRLIGEPQHADDLIFNLPSDTTCNKSLQKWVHRAGINKHITWHCARHSFAVNILNNGANIKTVASLLGHASLQHTEIYTRAVDSLKKAAIDGLPEIPIL